MLDNADQNVGKLVAFLGRLGELDNTIILFSSDNGGTDAGGEHGMVLNNRRYSGLAAAIARARARHAAELGGPQSISLYPTALGRGVEHAVPELQDLHRRRRAARQLHRVLASTPQRRGRNPPPAHACHRRDADPARSRRRAAPGHEQRQAGTRLRWRELRQDAAGEQTDRLAPSNTTSAGRTARTTATAGWRARYRSAARRSIWKIGPCTTWTRISRNRPMLRRSIRRSSSNSSMLSTRRRGSISSTRWTTAEGRASSAMSLPGCASAPTIRGDCLPGSQTAHRSDILPLVGNRSFHIRVRFEQRRGDAGVLWSLGDTIAGMVMYVEVGSHMFPLQRLRRVHQFCTRRPAPRSRTRR